MMDRSDLKVFKIHLISAANARFELETFSKLALDALDGLGIDVEIERPDVSDALAGCTSIREMVEHFTFEGEGAADEIVDSIVEAIGDDQ